MFYPTERVLTVFSAANWCGVFANSAAFLCVTCLGEAPGVRLQIKVSLQYTYSSPLAQTYTIKPIEEPSTLMLSDSDREMVE